MVTYLRKNIITEFPYAFHEKYDPVDVEVFLDDATGLRYVLLDEKRLYFKRSFTEKDIKREYNFLKSEQDAGSPHRYLTNEFNVKRGDVVADAGAAEGNFSLSMVEEASRLYLFETDAEWIEAMEATFLPWRSKVEIINRFVSEKNDETHVTLDEFFKKKQPADFLKIDVDGAESELLKGAASTLSSNRSLKVAICTYHQQDDDALFSELLKNNGFTISHSDGYMIFLMDEEIKPPYLRRGIIRAQK